MALRHYRRQLLPQKKPEIDTSQCYMCYVCPDYCTNIDDSSTPQPPPPPPPPPPSPAHQVSTILVVMLCILGFALVFLSYLTIRGYRIRSRRNTSPFSNNPQPSDRFRDDENQGPLLDHPIWYIRTVGFPQSVIDTIAVFKYDRGEGLIEGSDCSICLNEFSEDESLRLLPKCSHAFHVPCIDTWLRSHKNCPVCRAPVLSSSTNANNNATRSQVISVSTGTRNRDSGVPTDPQNLPEDAESGDRGNGLEEEAACDRAREFTNASCDHDSVVRRIEDGLLKNRVLSDLLHLHHHYSADHREPLRRSVSMDFTSSDNSSVANDHQRHPMNRSSYYCQKRDEGSSGLAVIIVEKQHDLDISEGKRVECNNSSLVKCSSHGRTTQRGPVSMKRSFSFSGRRSLWKHHIKSVESISIPEV